MCVVCSFYRIIACFYSSFLALMQEKKQKKIKVSGMPAKFSSSQVGAYCIRPIRRHSTDGECANRANYHDSSFHKWNACGAYAIRPYMETSKRGAFCTSYLVATPKRGAFCTSILGGTLKRGAFCTSILGGTLKRGAFCTSILGGTPKRGAFCTSILGGTPKRGAFCTSILDGCFESLAFFGRFLNVI